VEGTVLDAETSSPKAVNIREWRRGYDKLTKIPKRLVEELARATSTCETVWERARQKNDWKTYKPHLEKVLRLTIEKAEAIGYVDEPYDALLDDYEPGETTASLETTFKFLTEHLVDLVERIRGSDVHPNTKILRGQFPLEEQRKLSEFVAAQMGYDFNSGRLDTTAHPFTIDIGPGDVRITTRYHEDYFPAALYGTIHEAGHAMYEQGLPAAHWGTPMGKAVSLGVHESQSRFFENPVGRSNGMCRYLLSIAKNHFSSFNEVSLDEFVGAVNTVNPSLIRVEADEVTYNLHILLRFELELNLLRGNLKVDDLPEAWNEKMQSYLGVCPDSDDMARGVMQDVHWSAGLVGYFPTYTLGNLYAAQLYAKATEEIGNLEEEFAVGNFSSILLWLRSKVHEHGSTYLPPELIENATGEKPNPQYLIDYCNKKFGLLYNL
jgi:carboxypeptidase Taq